MQNLKTRKCCFFFCYYSVLSFVFFFSFPFLFLFFFFSFFFSFSFFIYLILRSFALDSLLRRGSRQQKKKNRKKTQLPKLLNCFFSSCFFFLTGKGYDFLFSKPKQNHNRKREKKTTRQKKDKTKEVRVLGKPNVAKTQDSRQVLSKTCFFLF